MIKQLKWIAFMKLRIFENIWKFEYHRQFQDSIKFMILFIVKCDFLFLLL